MEGENKNGTYNTLMHWHDFRLKLVLEGAAVGFFAGLIVVLYRFGVETIWNFTRKHFVENVHTMNTVILWLFIFIAIALVIGQIVKKEPMISGSGIPQVEGILLRKLKMNWFTVIIGKFLGGILAIGGGLSLGREGPSIQIGASVGQGFSRIFKRINVEEKYLITSGASAGLAAAFNAPLAGVMFALEEIHKNFSPLILISAMSASLTADCVSKKFFGLRPVFDFHLISPIPLKYYLYLIILGVITGVFGVAFNKMILKTQDIYGKAKWLKPEFRAIVPFGVAMILALVYPNGLGSGHGLIMHLFHENWTLKMLLVILIVKFFFTMICYGSGVPGGIFLPLLIIGAITGNIYGEILVKLINLDPMYIRNFIVLAMAAYFTAIVRAPITGSILITEMTGSFSNLLSLSVVSIVAYVVADALKSAPIYESLLERFISKNNSGENKFIGNSSNKVLLEVAVCLGTSIEQKKIKDIKWPESCLLVAIKRGQKEIIPRGNTTIFAGDYIIVLVDEDKASDIREVLVDMAAEPLIEKNNS